MYVAVALYPSGFGVIAAVIAATKDEPYRALLAAKRAEELGYTFTDGTSVMVVRVPEGQALSYGAYWKNRPGHPSNPVVFARDKKERGWAEHWFDDKLQAEYENYPFNDDNSFMGVEDPL